MLVAALLALAATAGVHVARASIDLPDAADVNQDGIVDGADLGIVIQNFGFRPFPTDRVDVNDDTFVNVLDLALIARYLGEVIPLPLREMVVVRAFPGLTFQQLTNLVQPDDGRDVLYVTEQQGLVLSFPNNDGASQALVYLDIRDRVSTRAREEGLLGLAFDPDYRENGNFYVYYSAANSRRSVVSRFTVSDTDPDQADPDSELIIMEVPQPFGNHNGGQIAFGPAGYLYIALGDGGGGGGDSQGNGQNLGTLLGSLLRIDVSDAKADVPYTVPPDNPFVGVSGARDEIWAYGLRNPWRFSFDEQTDRLWLADVGQSRWEEVDVIGAGGNYGWNIMEGNHCFQPAVGCDREGLDLPVVEYDHSSGCSITGGYVYRGTGLPSLAGAYLYGDYCSGLIWGLRYDGNAVTEHKLLVESGLLIPTFGEDAARNLYILSQSQGIYRMEPRQPTGTVGSGICGILSRPHGLILMAPGRISHAQAQGPQEFRPSILPDQEGDPQRNQKHTSGDQYDCQC